MNILESTLKKNGKFSNYQIQQILYIFKIFSSDISKIIIMGLLFHEHLTQYLVTLFFLLALRSFSGGMHSETYLGCLLTSFSFCFLSIKWLPNILLRSETQILLLNLCVLLCERMGPIISKYRQPLTPSKIKKCHNITASTIFIISVIIYAVPNNIYSDTIFWVAVLHTLQLVIAKFTAYYISMKGGNTIC